MYMGVLQYTTARLQVLFSLQHLGSITKGFAVMTSTILIQIYIYIY